MMAPWPLSAGREQYFLVPKVDGVDDLAYDQSYYCVTEIYQPCLVFINSSWK